ncbi:MAG: hypothetical protein ACUVTH_01365 [Thermogutta sp.]
MAGKSVSGEGVMILTRRGWARQGQFGQMAMAIGHHPCDHLPDEALPS